MMKPPIFIVGCGHSGTSLLLTVLGSHSNIHAIPKETRFAFSRKAVSFLESFDRQAYAAGKSRWVEKTPRHIYRINQLLRLCPDGRILLTIRDGRDVATSIGERKGSIQFGISRWVRDNRAGEAFWTHPNVHVIKYEDLVKDFETTVSGALNFLDETYEPAMRDFHKTPRFYYAEKIERPLQVDDKYHDQYRNWQINQALFDGRGKWRTLTEQEKQIIKESANDMLIDYGYVEDDQW